MSTNRLPENVCPIWAAQDSVDTAKQFHLELDNAERGLFIDQSWLMSQSRERKARLMDGLAVALLLMLAAALGCIAVLASAPNAKADPGVSDSVIDYAATYGAGAVCPVLDDHHTVNGVLGVLRGIQNDGFSEYESGQIVGMSVAEYCPRNRPLLREFVNIYGRQGTTV